MGKQAADTTTTQAGASRPALLDIAAVAHLLGCSARHVHRLVDAGRMPNPVRIGTLVRWRAAELDQWIAEGCPEPTPERFRSRGGQQEAE